MIEINRSDFKLFETAEKPIYVTGHKSPDSDTVGCAIGYARLLQALGYDAEPVVLGSINNETRYILNAAGLDEPKLMEDASGCSMVLVDMAFVQINILHDDVSCTYYLPSDEMADEVLQAAFQDETVSDGTLYKHEPCASRKAVTVPAISAVLEGYPKE